MIKVEDIIMSHNIKEKQHKTPSLFKEKLSLKQQRNNEICFNSDKKITLCCGKSSITLYPNGKIMIKGEYIFTDAEGINRLAGGRIELN